MCYLIREWKEEDAKDLAKALNNKNILKNLRDGLPYPYTETDALEYIKIVSNAEPNTTYVFAIVVNDKAVGSIGAFRQNNIHYRTAELGYYISEDYWGKGLMTEAVRQLCAYIFENTDIVRIFAEPFAYNVGSCHVLEKNGFIFEGILRNNAFKEGELLDMKMYAKLK